MILKKNSTRLIAILLLMALCFIPTAVFAEVPASDYICSYNAYIVADGNGKVSVWFSIDGTGAKMDEIGATKVIIYDASTGSAVKTFLNTSTPGMLGTKKYTHTGSVTYQGTPGTSYYATAWLWAGKDGKGDSRSQTTNTVVA